MNLKKKFESAKEKFKENAPAIAVTTFIAYLGVSALYLNEKSKQALLVTDEDLELMKEEDINMRYTLHGDDYALRYIGKTPSKN